MNQLSASYKNLLCVRADNMGDIIMSGPAIRALKETYGSRITLLTSSMGAPVTVFIPEIDEVMICDIPWVKANGESESEAGLALAERIKNGGFDAAVIFTVYSQSALPAALLTYLAGIPVRLAYCRENPYGLLTHWVPDQEPYTFIQHQVARDLKLVEEWGAHTPNQVLQLALSENSINKTRHKLEQAGINSNYIVFHPGVSEDKRKYPAELWAATADLVSQQLALPVIVSGAPADNQLATSICEQTGRQCYSMAGKLNMEEWIGLIAEATLLVSVNTAAVHIAAATQTPAVVLYALTNPQHTPWQSPAITLPFSAPPSLKSKNAVISYVDDLLFNRHIPYPTPEMIVAAANELLLQPGKHIHNTIIDVSSNPVAAHYR